MDWSAVATAAVPVLAAVAGGAVAWLVKDRKRDALERDLAMLEKLPDGAKRSMEKYICARVWQMSRAEYDHALQERAHRLPWDVLVGSVAYIAVFVTQKFDHQGVLPWLSCAVVGLAAVFATSAIVKASRSTVALRDAARERFKLEEHQGE